MPRKGTDKPGNISGDAVKRPGETKKDRQDRYLESLEMSISDDEALRITGIQRTTVLNWLKEEEFQQRYRQADIARGNNLEEGMFAVLGYHMVEERYTKILQYPSLLMFALRGSKPEKYAERTLLTYGQTQDDLKSVLHMDDTPPEKASIPGKPPKEGQEKDWITSLLAGVASDDKSS